MKNKEVNVCFDIYGEVKCATSYDEWCKTCPNVSGKVKKDLIIEKEEEDKNE